MLLVVPVVVAALVKDNMDERAADEGLIQLDARTVRIPQELRAHTVARERREHE